MAAPTRRLAGTSLRLPALTEPRARAVRHGLILAGVLSLLWLFVVHSLVGGTLLFDARAYHGIDLERMYEGATTAHGENVFRYSPPIALLFLPFSTLPWPLFAAGWLILNAALYVRVTGRWWPYLLAGPVAAELYMGNIHIVLAVAILVGFRYPAAWALVLLTKVTPGIGLLWFAVRREWRALAAAVAVTAVIAGATFVVLPGPWMAWLRTLTDTAPAGGDLNFVPIPLVIRLPLAAAVVVWGALNDRRWAVPLAATLALPTLWTHGLALAVVGVAAVLRDERRAASLSAQPPRDDEPRPAVAPTIS